MLYQQEFIGNHELYGTDDNKMLSAIQQELA